MSMSQNIWLWIFVGLCVLFSLIITIRLGVNQSPEQNQGYVKRRKKIVWLLLAIYTAAVLVWGAFVFPFLS
jgi:hypothetical protein